MPSLPTKTLSSGGWNSFPSIEFTTSAPIKEHAEFKTETASQGKDFMPESQQRVPFPT